MENKLTNYINAVRTKSKRYLLSLSLFLSGLLTNTVYADDPFAKTDALAQQGITKVQGVGVVTLGFAVVLTGLVYGFGGREVKAAIKKHWVAIAVSIIAVSAGPSIVEWFYTFVKG
ncbi:TrbC/VirB2 family protein [Streptococcus caprae]|uniref:TrbC/VirB2 family protein n=1 Tax=Streptococcus caprae TaxID=1640501 RepID=A0ABV8CXP2_9STRE